MNNNNKGKRNNRKKNKGGEQQPTAAKADSNGETWEETLNKPVGEDMAAMSSLQVA